MWKIVLCSRNSDNADRFSHIMILHFPYIHVLLIDLTDFEAGPLCVWPAAGFSSQLKSFYGSKAQLLLSTSTTVSRWILRVTMEASTLHVTTSYQHMCAVRFCFLPLYSCACKESERKQLLNLICLHWGWTLLLSRSSKDTEKGVKPRVSLVSRRVVASLLHVSAGIYCVLRRHFAFIAIFVGNKML